MKSSLTLNCDVVPTTNSQLLRLERDKTALDLAVVGMVNQTGANVVIEECGGNGSTFHENIANIVIVLSRRRR